LAAAERTSRSRSLPGARSLPLAGLTRRVRLLDATAGVSPILESAEIIDALVAHFLEHLAAERRTPSGAAVDDDGLVPTEIPVVIRRLGIGAEFQHPARDVYGAGDPAALLELRCVAHVDDQRVALGDHIPRLRRRNARHGDIGRF